jgi:hypothetical protein
VKTSSISASRCGSPVRDSWTILSESQVEISYKAALTATPATAPCSPDMENSGAHNSPICSPPPAATVRPVKSPPKLFNMATPIEVADSHAPASSGNCERSCGVTANVSSDEDFGYYRRKSRVAGSGSNKSRNNRKK